MGQNDGGPIDTEKIRSGEETRTNLMVRNIPCRYSKDEIKQDFEKNHKGRFNDLNLPMDNRQPEKTNKAYCFINFRHVLFLYDFIQDKRDYRWPKFESEKKIDFNFAKAQPITKFTDSREPSCQSENNANQLSETEREELNRIIDDHDIKAPLEKFAPIQSTIKPKYTDSRKHIKPAQGPGQEAFGH